MDRTTKVLYLTGMFVTLGVVMTVLGSGPLGVIAWVTLMVAFLWPVLWKRVPLSSSWGTVIAAGLGAGGFVYVFRDLLGARVGETTALLAALIAAPVLVLGLAYARFRMIKQQ
jgi:hypothetical protein